MNTFQTLHRAFVALVFLTACASQGPSPKPTVSTPPPPPEVSRLFDEALVFMQRNENSKARATLDAVIEASPGFALAHLERAQLLVETGEDASLALLDASFAAQSLADNPRAQMLWGRTLEDSGDDAAASDAYRRAVTLRPEVASRRRLAVVLERAGKHQESVEVWEALRDESPEDVGARLALAEIYEKTDRPASAEAEWTEVAARSPSNAFLLRRFADFLERQGKLLEARETRAQADELDAPKEQRDLRPLLPSRR